MGRHGRGIRKIESLNNRGFCKTQNKKLHVHSVCGYGCWFVDIPNSVTFSLQSLFLIALHLFLFWVWSKAHTTQDCPSVTNLRSCMKTQFLFIANRYISIMNKPASCNINSVWQTTWTLQVSQEPFDLGWLIFFHCLISVQKMKMLWNSSSFSEDFWDKWNHLPGYLKYRHRLMHATY